MTIAPSSGTRSKSLVLTAMIFAVAMTFIDQTIVSIAAPTIQHDLSLTSSGMQWAINAYLLTLAALVDAPKHSPESVAQQAFDAVEAGQIEVLADERTRTVKAQLSRDHELIYPSIQEFWDAAVSGTH